MGAREVEPELWFPCAESLLTGLGSTGLGHSQQFPVSVGPPHCFHPPLPSMTEVFTSAAFSRSSQLHLVSSVSCTWPHFRV